MIADTIQNMNAQETQQRSKSFSFSIASILGENTIEQKPENKIENQSTEINNKFTPDMFPIDHSTPKPEIIIHKATDIPQQQQKEHYNNNAIQSDILRQSWEIAFASPTEHNESFEHSPIDNCAHSDGNVSPNVSQLSAGSHSCTSSPSGDEPRRKKARTSFSARQLRELETHYASMRYISAADRSSLARSLGLSDQQVKTWFQNRRMKEKRNWNGEGDQPQHNHPDSATPSPQTVMPHPAALMGVYPGATQPAPNMLGLLPPVSMEQTDALIHRPQPVVHVPNGPLTTVPTAVVPTAGNAISAVPNMAQLQLPRQPAFVHHMAAALPQQQRMVTHEQIQQQIPHMAPMSSHGLTQPSMASTHYQSAFTKLAPNTVAMLPGVTGATMSFAPSASLGVTSAPMHPHGQMPILRAPMYHQQLTVPTPVYM